MVGGGYKKTEVGDIPEDWDVQTIGEAFEVKNNLRLPISKKVREKMEGPYPYYGPTGAQGNINEYRVEGEHALIGEDGDHFLKWRAVSMTLLVNGKFNVNNHAHIIKGERNLTSWFFWFFAHRDITSFLTRQGAGRFKLNKSSLISIPCAIPGFQEQQAIAEALADVGGLIDGMEKLIAKKRNIKTATMQQLLTGKTRLPGFGEGKGYKQTELGEIPGDWEVGVLEDCTTKVGSGITPTGGSRVYKDSGRPFMRSQNVGWGKLRLGDMAYIDDATHKTFLSTELQKNDVLLNITGASIGRCGFVDERVVGGNVNQHVCIIRGWGDAISPKLLMHYLLSRYGQKQIDSFQAGGNREGLNFNQIRSVKVFLAPTLEEQYAITDVLTDIDNELEILSDRLNKTKSIKQGMMQELLTGKIRLLEEA